MKNFLFVKFNFLIIICITYFLLGFKTNILINSDNIISDCSIYESISIEDVIKLEPEGTEDWSLKSGLIDGAYYEATIIFSDNTRGLLFKGTNSGKYFIEDSNGTNYYYNSLRSSVRALYIYKRYGCFSSKYRL